MLNRKFTVVLFILSSLIIGSSLADASQKIIIGSGYDIKSLKPVYGCPWGAPLRLIYETLVMEDVNLKIKPLLAQSWEVSEDGKVWTFHLRKGIKFHDGSLFDSQSAKFSFEYEPAPYRALTHWTKEIRAIDEYTLKFILSRPYAPLLRDLSSAPIMSPTSLDKNGKFTAPIGTGPFKFKKWLKGQKFMLVRNPDYWRGSSKLEEVIFRIIPDASTRAIALEAGEIDLAGHRAGRRLNVSDIQGLERNSDIRIIKGYTQPCVNWIQFNMQKEPFNNLQVRKAVYYAIDTQTIVNSLLGKTAVPLLKGPFNMPNLTDLINPNLKWYSYSPKRAKELLEETGWEDTDGDGIRDRKGKPLEVVFILYKGKPDLSEVGQVIQAQLGEVGMRVKLQVVEYGARQRIFNKGDYDMIIETGVCGHGDPCLWLNYFFHSRRGIRCSFKDKELTTLIDKLYTTLDSLKRQEVFYRIQEILEKTVPGVFLFTDANIIVVNKRVKNYELEGGIQGAYLSLWRVYIQE